MIACTVSCTNNEDVLIAAFHGVPTKCFPSAFTLFQKQEPIGGKDHD